MGLLTDLLNSFRSNCTSASSWKLSTSPGISLNYSWSLLLRNSFKMASSFGANLAPVNSCLARDT